MAVPAEVPARGDTTLRDDDGRVTLRPEVHLPVARLDVQVGLRQGAGTDGRVGYAAGRGCQGHSRECRDAEHGDQQSEADSSRHLISFGRWWSGGSADVLRPSSRPYEGRAPLPTVPAGRSRGMLASPRAYSRRVPIRLVLAEDHFLVREGVRRLLEADPEIEVAAVCGDLPSLLEAVD